MGGSITLRNGYCWAGSGWEFRAITRELEHYLDPDRDREIIKILHDPEGVAQIVDLVDLSDGSTWSETDAREVEKALASAFANVTRTHEWKSTGLRPEAQKVLVETLKRLCNERLAEPQGDSGTVAHGY
jgi:hypothetical protein